MKINKGAALLLLALLVLSHCGFAQSQDDAPDAGVDDGAGVGDGADAPDAGAGDAADAGVGDAADAGAGGSAPGTDYDADAFHNSMEGQEAILEQGVTDGLEYLGIKNGYCAADNTDLLALAGPAAIALLIVVIGIALVYMAGSFLSSPQLIAVCKQESLELVHTAAAVILFWLFISFSNSLLFGGTETMYGKALDYSIAMVHKITKDLFWLSALNTILYMIYSAPLRLGGVLHHAVQFNLGGVLKPFVDGVGTFASLLSFALGEWIANLTILCFIKKYMPTIFLPLGILMRSFPQTRGGGNALIALSMAFFLVYPVMLYMNYQAYDHQYGLVPERAGIQELMEDFTVGSGIGYLTVYGLFTRAYTGTFLGMAFLSQLVTLIFDLYADVLYTVFVLSIFLPLLNVFVTLTFAREISKYLGTEINISAFVKLI